MEAVDLAKQSVIGALASAKSVYSHSNTRTSSITVAHLRATSIYGAQPKEGLLMGRQTVRKRVEAIGANVLGAPSASGWTRRAGHKTKVTVASQAKAASSLSSMPLENSRPVPGCESQ
jgi:hypothetical protein